MPKKFAINRSKSGRGLLVAALTAALALSMFFVAAPVVRAAEYDTYLYITAAPNPVGVNQQLSITAIMPNVPPRQYPVESPGTATGKT